MTRYWRISIPCRSASARASVDGPHVEADHHRVRGGGEVDVVLGDAADARVDHVDAHLGVVDLLQLADDRLDRALHVALEDDVEVGDAARLELLEQLLERDAAARLLGERLAAQPLAALLRELAGAAVVLDDAAELAGRRRLVEAEDLDRLAGPGRVDLLAAVVVERAHAAPGVAGDDRVADLERAALHEHRRDRAAADVEPRLDDRAGGLARSGSRSARARGRRRAGSSRAARRGSRPASPRPSRPASSRPTPRAGGPGRRGRRARGPGSRPGGRSC